MSRNHRAIKGIWKVVRLEALDRDGWHCVKCGRYGKMEVHHKTSLKDGGTNELENLETLCTRCHIDIHRPSQTANRYSKGFDTLIGELIQ